MQNLQTKWSISFTSSWCGFRASVILNPHGGFTSAIISLFLINSLTWVCMVSDSYTPYQLFFMQTGGWSPVPTNISYPWIGTWTPSFLKTSRLSLTHFVTLGFNSCDKESSKIKLSRNLMQSIACLYSYAKKD